MVYTPTEPTSPSLGFLVAMDENGLINALKAHADFLLTDMLSDAVYYLRLIRYNFSIYL
jgi:hypothetical protein